MDNDSIITLADIDGRLDSLDEMIGDIRRAVLSADTKNIRIEALRAAAVVVAGEYAGGTLAGGSVSTIKLADQFLAWLETGER